MKGFELRYTPEQQAARDSIVAEMERASKNYWAEYSPNDATATAVSLASARLNTPEQLAEAKRGHQQLMDIFERQIMKIDALAAPTVFIRKDDAEKVGLARSDIE